MRTIWVTGVSCAGKSAVARRLGAQGYEAASTDGVDGLCRWVDRAGDPVDRPADPDLEWLGTHRWVWDATVLERVLATTREGGAQSLFLCGDATNALAFADRFDVSILLRVDRRTVLARLADPRRGNDFGRVGDSREHLLATFEDRQRLLADRVAAIVDATQDLDTVVRQVRLVSRAGGSYRDRHGDLGRDPVPPQHPAVRRPAARGGGPGPDPGGGPALAVVA